MRRKGNNVEFFLSLILLSFLFSSSNSYSATMNDYCITPPFVVAGVKPNLLLMLDNSASAYDLAYIDQTATATFCYDGTYKNSNVCSVSLANCTSDSNCAVAGEKCVSKYMGYFDPDKYYRSPTNGVTYRQDTTPDNTIFSQFQVYTGSFSSEVCEFRTAYLCVTTSALDPKITKFIAKGSFLNWLTASKMDVQKEILTGGYYDATNKLLISEGRGCVGSRYIKEIPGTSSDWITKPAGSFITFGVRGDISQDLRLPSSGGTTRIDIFKSSTEFNNQACQDAITCELGGGQGCQNKVASCIDPNNNVTNQARSTFNHSLTRCWQCPSSGCCPENIDVNGDGNIITGNYGQNNNECNSLTDAQRASLTPTDPMYICLKDTAAASPSGFTGCSMNSYQADVLGVSGQEGMTGQYIGVCYNANGSSDKGKWSSKCVQYQFAYFCKSLKVGEVVDPSSGTASTSQTGNIPAIMLDSGIMGQAGDPIRTFHVRVYSAVPSGTCSVTTSTSCSTSSDCPSGEQCDPSGLVQQYRNQIRFGAMTFNRYGSKAPLECGNPSSRIIYTCNDVPNNDGAKILSYIGVGKCTSGGACTGGNGTCPPGESCIPDVGSHSAGLVNAIDTVKASTWTPFSEAFYNAIGYFAQRRDLRLNADDFIIDADHDPIQIDCQKNNVLLITDGMSTADLNPSVYGLASANNYTSQVDTAINANIDYAGSRNLSDMAYIGQKRMINNFSVPWTAGTKERYHIYTHVVFSGTSNGMPNEADPQMLMRDTASYGGGTFQNPTNSQQLKDALAQAFQTIATGASSGTAASVLASGEGSGANLIQALFYPSSGSKFTDQEIKWIGALQNLWYFIDPSLGSSSIREDNSTPLELNIRSDNILHYLYVGNCSNALTTLCQTDAECSPGTCINKRTIAQLYTDSNGDGVADGPATPATKEFDNISYLWEAGRQLHQRTTARTIYYINPNSGNMELLPDSTTDAMLISLMQASGTTEASDLLKYIKGTDKWVCSVSGLNCTSSPSVCAAGETCDPYYRNRTATKTYPDGTTTKATWKLGDIVNSTPRIVSWVPLNLYHKRYLDKNYENFTQTAGYKSRGMVFVGANDGMLHAFNLGHLSLYEQRDKKASLSGSGLGEEVWAFLPGNSLPYLKYLADKNYGHLYYVDATPFIFDASIAGGANFDKTANVNDTSNWRTILIGSMRFGGAAKDGCTSDINGDGIKDSKDCVLTPLTSKGFSSYFALDITNPATPLLMWEFTHPDLGFTTSGPAVVRVGDKNKNGNWFVVLGSGPTGPIDPVSHQFRGYSDQNLKIFVLDLASGTQVTGSPIDTNIPYAFAGNMVNAAIDFDQDSLYKTGSYQDDALYFGFTKAEGSPTETTKWNKGGVLRVLTNQSSDVTKWTWGYVIDNIGPVTSAVAKLQDYDTKVVRLFFGTGRYYYKIADQIDDGDSLRRLYGLIEPCYDSSGVKADCTSASGGDTSHKASSPLPADTAAGVSTSNSWYIGLDASTSDYKAERVVTDTLATTTGAVFFTTTKPAANVCDYGGGTYLWAVQYDTGGKVRAGDLRGTALLQVSTGSIKEVDFTTAFPENAAHKEGRRTDFIPGVPPAGAPPGVLVPPKPLNRFIHIRER